MRRSAQVIAPLLAATAMAFATGCGRVAPCSTSSSAAKNHACTDASGKKTSYGGFGQSFSESAWPWVLGGMATVLVARSLGG
jgi:O-glycosyl hydrolase